MQQIKSADLMGNPAGLLPFVDRVVDKQEINGCCLRADLFGTGKSSRLEELSSILEKMRVSAQGETEIYAWMDVPVSELVTHILNRYHRPLGARLLNVEILIDMIMESHNDEVDDQTSRIKDGYLSLRRELLPHLLQEQDVLFPWILSDNGRSAVELIDDLRVQHKVIAMKTKTIAALASRIPMMENTCEGRLALYTTIKALETDVSDHVHIENNILFLRVLGESGRRSNQEKGHLRDCR